MGCTTYKDIVPYCGEIHSFFGTLIEIYIYITFLTPLLFGESGLLENEPTAPAEQAHTTERQ